MRTPPIQPILNGVLRFTLPRPKLKPGASANLLVTFSFLGMIDFSRFSLICGENWKQEELGFVNHNEPTSVLRMRSPSPPTSASTLSSSFGGPISGDKNGELGTAPAAAVAEPSAAGTKKDEWVSELPPISSGGIGFEDWENMFPETVASPSQEQSFFRWMSGEVDDTSFGLRHLLQSGNNPLELDGNPGPEIVDPVTRIGSVSLSESTLDSGNPNMSSFPSSVVTNNYCNNKIGFGSIQPTSSEVFNHKAPGIGLNSFNAQTPILPNSANTCPIPLPIPPGLVYQQQLQYLTREDKPQNHTPEALMNPQFQHLQYPNFPLPLAYASREQLPIKHQNSRQQEQFMGFPQGVQFLPLQQTPPMVGKPKMVGVIEEMVHHNQQEQQQALLDQLYKAAELIGTGNFSLAQGILARLNHQLCPIGKPLYRAAFYFKKALQSLLMNNPVTAFQPRTPTLFDVIFKMGAYKLFSEVSPYMQFVNFTCNQALLEVLGDVDRIHIIDFDIGFGVQWASFMQELSMRNMGAPSLKITAICSLSSHHEVEFRLMQENLTQFASDIGMSFEFQVFNFDCLEQSSYSLPISRATENEAIAVVFPIWSCSNQPAKLPSLLQFVKQLCPRIVVSLDRGSDRSDLSIPQHILQSLHSYLNLLDSLDAANVTSDAVNKIETFLLQPTIESTVLGRLRSPEKMPLWKTLFATAGFFPISFSSISETQAECLLKRIPASGFHIEKCQSSLVLCWQCKELISASAWRC